MSKCCKDCSIIYLNNLYEHFHKCARNKDGLANVCKKCRTLKRQKLLHVNEFELVLCLKCNEYKHENNFDKAEENWFRKHLDRRCKECKTQQYNKRRINNRGKDPLERLLTERFCGVKTRSINNKLELDFDREYLKSLWFLQKGKCALTNIDMTYELYQGRTHTNFSVDRIDSSKGYIKGNIQLVCMVVNQMKNNLTVEELMFFCKAIIQHEENK